MQRFLSLSRLILPVVFLFYALAANYAAISREWTPLASIQGRLLNGEVANRFGTLYADALPHREFARGWLGAARYVLAAEGRDGVAVGQGGWLFTTEETRLASPAQINRAVDYIIAVDRRLAARGIDLVVVPVPAKLDILRHDATAGLPAEGMARQYARFVQELTDYNISVVDARSALVDADTTESPTFLRTDTHWSPHGARTVANAVAASGFLATGAESFREVSGAKTALTGDLVRFVTTDAMAPRLGLTQETVLSWVAEAEDAVTTSIFAAESAPPDIVLVGTSYSANPNWSFGPSLTLALHREVLNLAEEGQGPIRPMAAFLEELSPSGQSPATVIWEFPIRYLADPDIWMDAVERLASSTAGGQSDG